MVLASSTMACKPLLPTRAAAALMLRSPLSFELPVQAEKFPDSKLSTEITSDAPAGGCSTKVCVGAAVEAMVGTIAVGDEAGTPVDVGPVVGEEAGAPVEVGPTVGEEAGAPVEVGPAVGDKAGRVEVGPVVGDEAGTFVNVDATVGGTGVKVFVAVGATVAVRVAVGAGGCVRVGVGFVPEVLTQLAVPESVKVCPAIGTNCQS